MVLASSLPSCAGPGLRIDTAEPDAALYLDGQLVGHGVAEMPFRYYGAAAVTAVPARHSELEDVRAPGRTVVRTAPPAPHWLFPFDFFVEVVRRGFAPAPPVDTEVALPQAGATLVSGTRPPRAEELRARAERAQRER